MGVLPVHVYLYLANFRFGTSSPLARGQDVLTMDLKLAILFLAVYFGVLLGAESVYRIWSKLK